MRKSKPLTMLRPSGDRYWLVVADARQLIEHLITEGASRETAMLEGSLVLAVLSRFEQDTAQQYLLRSVTWQAGGVSG